MRTTTRLGWSLASLVVALLTACGGAVKESGPAGSAGESATGGATGIDACAYERDQPPGQPVYDEMTLGRGECAAVSLAQVLRAIEALRPDLNDVTTLYAPDPDRGGDGSFRYAFLRPGGGFAVVFKRGDGDCPSGCITNDYWYFETGVDCDVQEVGEAHRGGDGCIQPDQLPRWGIPHAALPSEICDAELSPQDLSGSYLLPTCGQASSSCFLDRGDKGASQSLPQSIMLSINQDPAALGQGLIYLNGTELPGIDGVPFAATFERMKVTAFVDTSNLPSACPEQSSLQFEYDFEGPGRRLSFNSSSTPDCANAPGNYCKSEANAVFGDATRLP